MVNTFPLNEPRRLRRGWRDARRPSRSARRSRESFDSTEVEEYWPTLCMHETGINQDAPACPLCGLHVDRYVGEYCRSCHPWRIHNRIVMGLELDRFGRNPIAWKVARQRSFQLLRGVVESNPRVSVTSGGYELTGSSGARWRITSPECLTSHHHEPFDVLIRCHANLTEGDVYWVNPPIDFEQHLWAFVCIHSSHHGAQFPIGDQLCAVVLGLLNDITLSAVIPQILGALVHLSEIEDEKFLRSLECWAGARELNGRNLDRRAAQHHQAAVRDLSMRQTQCLLCRSYGHNAEECDWDYLEMG